MRIGWNRKSCWNPSCQLVITLPEKKPTVSFAKHRLAFFSAWPLCLGMPNRARTQLQTLQNTRKLYDLNTIISADKLIKMCLRERRKAVISVISFEIASELGKEV